MLGRKNGTELPRVDFVAVAEGMGVDAERVEGVDQFEPALQRALDRSGPTLLDIDMELLAPIQLPLPAHQRSRDDD